MNIVIVDDQTSARTMLRHILEDISPELEVFDFGDPETALRWCDDNRPDLLLLDYRMPVVDGLEFARRFRRPLLHRDVPIVLVTVVGDEPVRQAALDVGVIDFLVKPVRPRELRARCRNLLQLRQQSESVKQRALSLEQRLLRGMSTNERDLLFGLLDGIRTTFGQLGQNADGAQRLQTGSKLSFIETLPISLQSRIANIDNIGDVHPDTYWWQHTVGNVRRQRFSDIWLNEPAPLLQELRQHPRAVNGRCAECRWLSICNGNTRTRAWAQGDLWAEDPGCYLSDEEIGLPTPERIPSIAI